MEGEAAPRDQQIGDDLIVSGSTCTGADCVNGEAFGDDALRLKQPVVRLHFEDTSTTAGFPANDWRISINDAGSSGADRFSIEDATAGTTPFTLLGGSPNNSFFVNAAGNVGFGTTTPLTGIHVVRDGFPTNAAFLLENTGGSVPRVWFFQNQSTNGAFVVTPQVSGTLAPLKLFPGAPENSLTIGQNGGGSSPRVGFHRVSSVQHPIHVGTDASNGNGAHLTAAGVWTDGSSRAHKTGIVHLGLSDALSALERLEPVRYRGQEDATGEEYLGFIAEEVPELVAMEGRQGLSPMDLVAVLTRVVQEQQRHLEAQDGEIAELARRLDELQKGAE